MRRLLLTILFLIPAVKLFAQKTTRYDLFVSDTIITVAGGTAHAIAVNGQFPAPTLTFTEGDTAEIILHNTMDVETSLHWHGVILPNMQDGVPYLTTAPTMPHEVHLYKFPIVQNGTFFYHAHTEWQEQSGLYGALVFKKRAKDPSRRTEDELPEYTMVLSDWTNESPAEVQRSLHNANDWYAIEKHSTQNWGEALLKGYFWQKAEQEWLRMFPMDVSDVYYDAFLTNGLAEQRVPIVKAGSKMRLRIVNASSSTYFWLQYSGSKISVIASDGSEVVPVSVDKMIIGVAETYDLVVSVPESMSYEFKATAEDRSNSTSLWLGSGMKMPAPVLPQLNYFEGMKMMNAMMHLDGSMDNMGMRMTNQTMDMNSVMYPENSSSDSEPPSPSDSASKRSTKAMSGMEGMGGMEGMNMGGPSGLRTLNYAMLRSVVKTTLPLAPERVVTLDLTGNMNRYQWSINNVPLSGADRILLPRGTNVRMIISNQTMMRHPMHLHGYSFRLLNGKGDYAPLKDVIDVMPMEVDTIEFAARYDGDWFFHCHILYHMMTGMGRVFRVTESGGIEPLPNSQIESIKDSWQKFADDDNMWALSFTLAAQSQGIFPKIMLMDRNYMFDAMGMVNYKGSFESEAHFGRFLDRQQFLEPYVGIDIRMLHDEAHASSSSGLGSIEDRKVATLGVRYLLPLFIQTDLRIDHTGRVRFQIARNDLALTARLRFDAMWNTDNEYELGLRYILTKRFSLTANYDSHFGFGGGIAFTY